MKIEKINNDNLTIIINKEEFKKAFSSYEQLKEFREDLINLIDTYHQCCKEIGREF